MSWRKLFRRKVVDRNEVTTELHRVLTTLDLTLLGIGSTLGTGIYVLAGQVAKMDAGPAVVISFLIAAIASVLAGLCYAEFGARVPKAGSAYVYSYVCVGEIIAFIVGWNLVMEYVIGVASVSKAYSGYVDSIVPNHTMSKFFKEIGEIHVSFLGSYFDFFSFGITIVLTLILMFGVKESSIFNNVFTVLNLLVMFFVIIAGGLYSSFDNWTVDPLKTMECENISSHTIDRGEIGKGGFTPFGFTGIMAGAATCFYGFIGFDVIATTGEEAKNPKRAIPISIVLSLLFIFIAYFGISTVLTMMVPYYCQYEDAPLPYAFEYKGFTIGKWIVNIGALFALATSLLGSMFPMPRIIYSMARDGLLFKFLAYVHPRFQTPMWATLIGGFLGAIMGALFNLNSLIDMMSIGTLTAYTLVALCVLMLRYRKDESGADDNGFEESEEPVTLKMWFRQIFNLDNHKVPTKLSSQYTTATVVIYCILCFAFCGTAVSAEQHKDGLTPEVITMLGVFGALLILEMISLAMQPVSRLELSFRVPLVPWIPGLSILVNTYLILELSWETWVRFAVWMLVGLVIYIYCLCTGRADKQYNSAYEQFQNNKKLESSMKAKSPLQGIDNPALVYEHEDNNGTLQKEKPPSKTEEPQSQKEFPANLQQAKSILLNQSPHNKAQDSLQKSQAPTTQDPILKIFESNRKYMDELDSDPPPRTPEEMVDAVISSAMLEAEALKKQYPQHAQKLVSQVISQAEQQETLLKIHKACQECLNESKLDSHAEKSPPILSSPADREESQSFLQNHLRKSVVESPGPVAVEKSQNESEALNRIEDVAKRQEYIHMVAQLCLNGVNIDSIPWLLQPPSVSKEVQEAQELEISEMEQSHQRLPLSKEEIVTRLRLNGVNIESIPWSIQEAIGDPVEEPESDLIRINKIAQLSQNGVNIESVPWPIEQILSTEAERDLTKELVRREAPPSPIPSSFTLSPLEQTLRIHERAQRSLREGDEEIRTKDGVHELERIHKAAQLSVNGVNVDSPWSLDQETPDPISSSPDRIVEMHNKAQESLNEENSVEIQSPKDPATLTETIHKIAQLCLQRVNVESVPWLQPVLSSDEERQEVKQLHHRMVENMKKTQENIRAETVAPPPPSPSPEQIAREMEIHNAAQEMLRVKIPNNNSENSSERINTAMEDIHRIAQLCLNGVNIDAIPWLEPLLLKNKEREEVKQLNQRLLQSAKDRQENKEIAPLVSPLPASTPEHHTKLAEIHNAAQECLRVRSNNQEVAAHEEKNPVDIESVNKINQLCLNGISVPWLQPILTSSEEKQQIQQFNKRATEEAIRQADLNKATISAEAKKQREPISPAEALQAMERLAKVHETAQESLRGNSPKAPLKDTKQKKISVTFKGNSPPRIEDILAAGLPSDEEQDTDGHEVFRQRLAQRRPTGPFLPQLGKLNLNRSASTVSEDEDGADEEDDEEVTSYTVTDIDLEKTNEEPQAATPRKQSIQNRKPVDDLIAIFEQGK